MSILRHVLSHCECDWVMSVSVWLQKVRLMDFEQRFQEKVMEVDDKYRLKLQDLMTQNTELN